MSTRKKILDLVKKHYEEEFPIDEFIPGKSQVPVSGRSFDHRDIESLIDFFLSYTDYFYI